MQTVPMLASLALALSSLPAAAQQERPQEHVRGDVEAVSGDTIAVRTRDGRVVHLDLTGETGVNGVEEADAGAITDGAFVGTTAVPQPDGSLRALEVHVFPEAMRGVGEGHRPWDLQSGSSMTNATVTGTGPAGKGAASQGTGSSMTNATVQGTRTAGGARTLALRYGGGKQTVVVPAGVPIVRITAGDRSLLVPGAHVFAIAARQDGRLVAQRLVVGTGGVVPPM